MIEIYVGAICNPSANKGGWGVVLIGEEGHPEKCNGCEEGASQPRMILEAAIEGLSRRQSKTAR